MYYFAYGSNMSQEQMKNRCPDSRLIGSGVLKNYHLDFLEFSKRWQGGCADIIPYPNSEVWGLVYEVSDDDIARLDKFEGHPSFYRRTTLIINLDKPDEMRAEVYILVNKKPFTPPTKKYLGIIIEAARVFNFPINYQEQLKNIATME